MKANILLICIITLILIPFVYFSSINLVRVILGLPFLFLFPGYTLLAVLFPQEQDLRSGERLALSFGSSILFSAIIGFILNYTPLGIQTETVILSLAAFVIALSMIAWYRLRHTSLEFNFRFFHSHNETELSSTNKIYKSFYSFIIVALLAGLVVLSYVVITNKTDETYTQFFLPDLQGDEENYLDEIKLGDDVTVAVGIINNEQDTIDYLIETRINGVTISKTGLIQLPTGGMWEGEITFKLTGVGDNQKVEFLLYKSGEDSPYRRLLVWMNVNA